jgi:hypothetical protein
MKIIVLVVAPDGATRVETHGFVGAACREASRFIELSLGTNTAEKLTPEYHEVPSTSSVIERQSAGGS